MKEHKGIMPIITIVIAIIVVLIVAKLLFVPVIPGTERTINSVGSSELIANPDQAEAYLRIDILRDTAEQASAVSKDLSTAVVAAVKAFSGATVETTNYNIYKREDWTPNGTVFKGYQATYSLKVSTKNMADIGKIIDAAVQAGANGVDSVQFTLSKDNEEKVRSEALKQASANAKMKAEAVADGLGVKLGSVVAVSESNFYAPPMYYAKMAESVSSGGRAADIAVEPTTIQVSATISVTYKIK